ncbi:MAG: beta-ketoacyl-[acyl-carrier-protein] synthase family protein [Nonlabens sp.]
MSFKKRRVVVTGLGVVAPSAVGVTAFAKALHSQKSGIRHDPQLANLNFGCQVSGTPQITQEQIAENFTPLQLRGLKASGLVYGVIAGKEAFNDAGLSPSNAGETHIDTGTIFGTGQSGGEKFREAIHLIDDKRVRRLGSNSVIQTMTSGISAWLAGELGLGNIVTSNSSACCTGTEAFIQGYERIAHGFADKMLVGSTSDSGPYIWGGFDAMRILPTKYNDHPEQASRPMSAQASGFVPGSGAGAFMLESLESATSRNARIYCEIKGGVLNSGGQRNGGSMTAPNRAAVQQCIKLAVKNSGIEPAQIDAINGHLTATSKDAFEIQNWKTALGLCKAEFPPINTFKSTIGHTLAAAGSIELVGSILQIRDQVIYGNKNCEPVKSEILDLINTTSIPQDTIEKQVNHLIKASFGFGDVNACVVLSRLS